MAKLFFAVVSLLCTIGFAFSANCSLPLIGSGIELSGSPKLNVDCGDTSNSSDCPRQFIAYNYQCPTCYSSISIPGNYSLLGSIRCSAITANCSINIYGSITVGCCSKVDTTGSIAVGGSISIGDQSLIDISLLSIGGKLVVGDHVYLTENLEESHILIDIDSSLVINSSEDNVFAQVQLAKSILYVTTNSNLNYKGIGWSVTDTYLMVSWNSNVQFLNMGTVVLQGSSIFAYRTLWQTPNLQNLFILNSKVNFYIAHVYWTGNSSIYLDQTTLSMDDRSQWLATNAVLNLKSATVTIGSDTNFNLFNCEIESTEPGLTVSLSDLSTLSINQFGSDRLYCNLTGNITVPLFATYTEADVRDSLQCSTHSWRYNHGFTAETTLNKPTAHIKPYADADVHLDSCQIPPTTSTAQVSTTTVTTTSESTTTVTTPTTTLFQTSTGSLSTIYLTTTTKSTTSDVQTTSATTTTESTTTPLTTTPTTTVAQPTTTTYPPSTSSQDTTSTTSESTVQTTSAISEQPSTTNEASNFTSVSLTTEEKSTRTPPTTSLGVLNTRFNHFVLLICQLFSVISFYIHL